MTDAQVETALARYEALLEGEPAVRANPHDRKLSPNDQTLHLLFMISEIRTFLGKPESREKMMRWYGFLQGVLWSQGYYSLEQLKDDNR